MQNVTTVGIIIPNITHRAGTERAVCNLANILNKQGKKVFIFSIASVQGKCSYELNSNVEIVHLNLPFEKHTFSFAIKHYINIYKFIKQKVKELNINVLVGTYNHINCMLSFFSPYITTIGCEHFNYLVEKKLFNLLKRLFYRKLSAVVLLTERDRLCYSFLKQTFVIPNSLSFFPVKTSDCTSKVMISLGRLTKQKGYDLLLDALNKIKNNILDWKVYIYGAGEEKENLEKLILQYGLQKIISICEPVDDVESIYTSASIYLSPSRWEGFPMVLLEAQACGLPCIAFDYPCGATEIIQDKYNGYVVDLYDTQCYAEKILDLTRNIEKRIDFGKNASVSILKYSTENISLLWKNLFDTLED